MNEMQTPDHDFNDPVSGQDGLVLRVPRRPLYQWLAWFVWLVVLGILAEFALTSFAEHETQAGVLAAALLAGILLAGLIVEAMYRIEQASIRRYRFPNESEPNPDDITP